MEQSGKTSTQVSSRFARYNASARGQARRRRYEDKHPNRGRERIDAGYFRDYYHRKKEETGYHGDARDMLPGFRVKEALLGAEVVEIKG